MSETHDIVTPEARAEIIAYLSDLDTVKPHEDAADDLEIRLQIHDDGTWSVHTGDSQYDQDHRGHWGNTSVPWSDDSEGLPDWEAVADDLLDQCDESAADGENFPDVYADGVPY